MNKKVFGIILVVVFVSFTIALNQDKGESKNSIPYTIENCVNQFDSSKTMETKVGYQYWFVDKNFLDGRTLKISAVAPHSATHAPHLHTEDEFFFVLEGLAEFHLNGETVKAKPYASFYCPPNSVHGIRNIGETELKYLVIKKYNLNPQK
jgi:mannose-6-phosphate isomerase-like protein (cupin superfamily)